MRVRLFGVWGVGFCGGNWVGGFLGVGVGVVGIVEVMLLVLGFGVSFTVSLAC